MKFKFEDRKYFLWGATAFGVVAASMLLYYTIFHMKSVISGIRFFLSVIAPVIYGFVIAYILSGVVKFLEEQVIYEILKRKGIKTKARSRRVIRWCCVFLSIAFMIIVIYALIMMILPQLIRSISNIIYSFPIYMNSTERWLNTLVEKGWKLDENTIALLNQYSTMAQNYLTGTILPRIQDMLMNISSGVFNVVTVIKNLIVGAVVSLYLLADKESFVAKGKMILYALFSKEHANAIIHSFRFTHKVFGGFISGKLLDSAIIGVLCYVGITIMNMPYTILISVIIGVTNIIPFFGPYLGAIPCAFLILLVSPMKGLYFIIFLIILQQFDGNILGPKILGDSTGLSSFMVILAILIGGGFFGIAGMLVGVPLFAVFYAAMINLLQSSLADKGLPTEEVTYINIDCLDEQSGEVIPLKDDPFNRSQNTELQDNWFTRAYIVCMNLIKIVLAFIIKTYRACDNFIKSRVKTKENPDKTPKFKFIRKIKESELVQLIASKASELMDPQLDLFGDEEETQNPSDETEAVGEDQDMMSAAKEEVECVSEPEAEADCDADIEADADLECDAETEAGTEAGTDTENDADTKTEAE